jgi:hypothetical protein
MYKLIPKYLLYNCYKSFVQVKTIVARIFPKTQKKIGKKGTEYSFFHFQFSIQNENSTERTVAACEIRLSYLSWILGHITCIIMVEYVVAS